MRVTRSRRRRKARRSSTSPAPANPANALAGALGLGVAALTAAQADAATFNVTSLADSGAGTLRQAVADANAAAGADVITFQAGLTGTITLTSGQLEISDSVDIQGPGPAVISVSGNNATRVFYIYNAAANLVVDISGLTVTAGSDSIGGGIVNFDEDLTLDNMVITGNAASGDGGGLWADGFDMDLTITNTQITGNTAGGTGGGIYIEDTGGPLLIQDSVISGNYSFDCGGGVYFYDPDNDVTIDRTTIANNTTPCMGGGVYLYNMDSGTFTVSNSTVSGNTADGPGGGLVFYDGYSVAVRNSTISGNSGYFGGGIALYRGAGTVLDFVTIANNTSTQSTGGGVFMPAGSMVISNSILADNIGGADLEGGGDDSEDLSFSLVETAAANIVDNGGNLMAVDPMLGPLANNGGPTQTQRPQPTSPVIDAADPATTVATDQRGQPREYPVRADMGALEIVGGVIQFSPTTYTVAENGGSVSLTVIRDVGTDPATADLATAAGTATAGADFTTTAATVNFVAGDLSETVNVPILDDAFVEPSEQFTAALSNPSDGATIGTGATATVTITDFEPGQFQLSSATYAVAENGGSITITVNRVNGANGPVSVNYTTAPGGATADVDYTTTTGTLNWADGDAAPKTFVVPILDDTLVEGNEAFAVSLNTPGGGATVGTPATATVTITDVEPGQFTLSSATYAVAENGGSVTITVNRVNGTTGPVSVNYATAPGSATAGADYTTTSGTLNWADGDAAPKTFVIPILDDALVEGNEAFAVSLNTPGGGATIGTPGTATVTINDIEPGQVAFSSATYAVLENGGSITITVNRSGGSTGAASVNYTTTAGSAAAGADYTTTSGTLNWADGDLAPKTFSVPILDDAIVEGDETFTVTLSGATGATIGSPNPSTVTIGDVETGTAQFSVSSVDTTEGAGTVTLTVTRIGGTTGPLTVNFTTSDGSATAGQDYTAASGTITFPDGDATPQTITIPILDDAAAEPAEAFNVTLNGPSVGTPAAAVVTIAESDAAAIPALDGFGKIVLALAAALAGLFVITRRNIWSVLLALALIGFAVPPVVAQARVPSGQAKPAKHAKEEKAGKTRGTLASVTRSEGKVTLTFEGGASVTVADAKLRVLDARGPKRGKSSASALAAGQKVTVHLLQNGRARVKITG